MKLLLDELYTDQIARRLRSDGHDVVSVHERSDLQGLDDASLFVRMVDERRAIVTEDARGFIPLVQERSVAGEDHYGLVLRSPRRLPRARSKVGLFVRALSKVLATHPREDGLKNQVLWL